MAFLHKQDNTGLLWEPPGWFNLHYWVFTPVCHLLLAVALVVWAISRSGARKSCCGVHCGTGAGVIFRCVELLL